MLKKILIAAAAIVVVFLVVVFLQPSTYHVERSKLIDAPAEMVWAQISDFENWKAWNPWQRMEPDQTIVLAGEPGGLGHSSSWKGEKTGEGKMTIVETARPTHLGIELEFLAPMHNTAESAFDLTPQDAGVNVTWSMNGNNGFIGKMFGLFMSMDDMIGTSYDQGLADLKAIVERQAKTEAEAAAAAADLEDLANEQAEGDEAP